MAKRKFDQYDDAEGKKLYFEEDYEDKLESFNECIEEFLERYDYYDGEESFFDFWENRQRNFLEAVRFLNTKVKPFFDKHSSLYENGIYEIYEEMCQEVYNYRNDFIFNDLPEIKKDIANKLAEENSQIEESKNLKLKIMETLIAQGSEIKRALLIREIGENDVQAIEAIDEMVASEFLTKTKKGNVYYVSVVPNTTIEDITTEADKKIKTNLDYSEKVLAFNPRIEKMPTVAKMANNTAQNRTVSRMNFEAKVNDVTSREQNIERSQQTREQGKKTSTWEIAKTFLLNILLIPIVAFIVVGMIATPGFGALAMAITGGLGIYKLWKKTTGK